MTRVWHMVFIKHAPAAHPQATMVEAAGLRWLAQAAGAPVVPVLRASPGTEPGSGPGAGSDARRGALELEELSSRTPDAASAQRFGAALARTHAWLASRPGAAGFGALPPEHPVGTPAYFGPAERPLALGIGVHNSWGAFTATERLDPVLQALEPSITAEDAKLLRAARDRIGSGVLDDDEPPALIHGDLWAGNVLWTSTEAGAVEAVLIDPAAHAGHRETDIALLHLFGLPELDAVISGYQQEHALREGWRERIPLHQLFCLEVHWLLFGASYRGATLNAAEAVLRL
ncbi:fructosamine kinase family protein [Nesterenkonia sp. E16_10]|uniref:fructosamine kinase family protein n=1 Tax=unclassified Nesterenkonia TaxID=2629769 RepID=UPI0031F70B23